MYSYSKFTKTHPFIEIHASVHAMHEFHEMEQDVFISKCHRKEEYYDT